MNYYYSTDGLEVQGPYTLSDLSSYFSNGALPATTQVCPEGTENWQLLASLLQPPTQRTTQPPPLPQQNDHPPPAGNQATLQARQSVPYAVKVLTTKDRALGGKFDPDRLEAALNSYTSQGWSVAGCDSAEFPGLLGGVRSELITVMHRIPGRMKKYKILTQKDRYFGGKFDPERLEKAINSYVSEGWQVRAVTTATFPGFGSSREEMIIVLEKEV